MDNKFALGISLGVLPTEEIFFSLAAAGISCVEISVLGEGRERLLPESENIRAMARRYGICLWSMHLPFGREEMNFCAPDAEERERTLALQKENLRVAHALGIERVVVHGGIPLPQTERKKYFAIAKKNIALLQTEASRLGITVCVETLMPSCIGRNSREILEILDAHPDLRVCLDPNHLLGESHEELIRRIGNRIVTTHISDYDFLNERHWMPGEGKIDWPRLIAALRTVGCEGPLLYEVSPFKTPQSIDRRALSFADYKENHCFLLMEQTPKAIGIPNKEICENSTFAKFCLQTYGVTYDGNGKFKEDI
jgi:sugar phosphate isomerase/epimerase